MLKHQQSRKTHQPKRSRSPEHKQDKVKMAQSLLFYSSARKSNSGQSETQFEKLNQKVFKKALLQTYIPSVHLSQQKV